eukprot:SAG22_NODE_103_length_20175_cov_15.280833_13_plen_104_part_00
MAQAGTIRAEFKELEEQAFAVMEKYNAAQTLLNEKTAEVQAIQADYDKLKAGVAVSQTVAASQSARPSVPRSQPVSPEAIQLLGTSAPMISVFRPPPRAHWSP